jgi:hypothetical protein
MTTLVQLLLEKDKGSEGLLAPSILETVDTWLSWWERDALEHVKWCQNKKISDIAAMGRLHQIQEIRRGLTDKQSTDSPT